MGGGSSSTTTVRKRDPESAELKELQSGIYNILAPILGVDTSTNAYQNTISDAVNNRVIPNAQTQLKRDDNGRYYYEVEHQGFSADENGSGDPYTWTSKQYVNDKDGQALYNAQNQIGTSTNDDWANSYFGRSWLDMRDRIDAANNAYDQALAAAPGLQGNVLNTAGQIADLSKTAQSALQPNINNINNASAAINALAGQVAGLGDAEARALQPNINRINDLSGKIGTLGDTVANAAANYKTQSNNLNAKIEGVGDRQGTLANTIQAFTESGNIPEEMRRNLMSTVNNELRTNTGSTLNDLASRGVMNSTVANRSINNLSNAAADAYAKNYLEAYNSVLGGYGQTNNTLSSQADTYSKAFQNANTGWNDLLNGYQLAGNQYNNAIGGYNTANANIRNSYADRQNALNSASGQYQNAISGWNTANNNISQGYNNRLNGLNAAMSGYQQAYNNNASQMQNMAAMPQTLAKSAFAQYEPVYNYWQGLRNSYDSKEDYDTVVKQGK